MTENGKTHPFKFVWGTFCREILTNEKGEKTLYNVLPSLEVQAHLVAGFDPGSRVMLPLGELRAYILLERLPEIDKEQAHLSFDVASPEGVLRHKETHFLVSSRHPQLQQEINLNGLAMPVSLGELRNSFTFEVIVSSEGEEIGRCKLPVRAELKVVGSAG